MGFRRYEPVKKLEFRGNPSSKIEFEALILNPRPGWGLGVKGLVLRFRA